MKDKPCNYCQYCGSPKEPNRVTCGKQVCKSARYRLSCSKERKKQYSAKKMVDYDLTEPGVAMRNMFLLMPLAYKK